MDDIELAFGNRIVRLEGTVVEVFGLAGLYAGTRIPVNYLGVKVKDLRHDQLEVSLGWRRTPFDAQSSLDVLDDDSSVQSPAAILTLSATQWPLLQPLLVEAAKRRTLPID